eukprot:GCRY01007935.1.p1 GENE.GCRY01007935.1~~GCRY01007935.1.p1  ORF type:complete len:352 (+),score=57.36 GCRY01007935.1:130-1056(+)
MYTNLPQDDLVDKVGLVIDEAIAYAASKVTRRTRHSSQALNMRVFLSKSVDAEWTQSARNVGSEHCRTLTPLDLKEIVGTVVHSTFVAYDHGVLRQILGLPMGTNSAPLLANLYLYYYESRLIDTLSTTHPDIPPQLENTFRLIDDVLSVDCPVFRELTSPTSRFPSFYPRALLLEETTASRDPPFVHFLGMKISGGQKLSLDVYDKRRSFPFSPILYPHISSNVPSSSLYGIFMGQLHRFSRICSSVRPFLKNVLHLLQTMRHRGYSQRRLLRQLKSFFQTHSPYPLTFPAFNAILHRLLRENGELN